MSVSSAEELQGRLIAHRRVLVFLLARLCKKDEQEVSNLSDLLLRDFIQKDGQEDPGAVPDPGLAITGAITDELRMIARELESLRPGLLAGEKNKSAETGEIP